MSLIKIFSISAGPRLDRMSSPAQSEDSGLAADRGTYTTYATLSIPRENAQAMGIVFSGKNTNNMS